jgi:hypothetical protein
LILGFQNKFRTALQACAAMGRIDVLRYLIEKARANVMVVDKMGYTR